MIGREDWEMIKEDGLLGISLQESALLCLALHFHIAYRVIFEWALSANLHGIVLVHIGPRVWFESWSWIGICKWMIATRGE